MGPASVFAPRAHEMPRDVIASTLLEAWWVQAPYEIHLRPSGVPLMVDAQATGLIILNLI